ncbi:MAG: SGNH/GDSL hydrolase family protein [Eubacterium sp.]|nr:SGNH/GDSL hydrolase family protein [Eubacterium sp.]
MTRKSRITAIGLVIALACGGVLPSFSVTNAEEFEPTIPPDLLPTSVPKWTPAVTLSPATTVTPFVTKTPTATQEPDATLAPTSVPEGPTEEEQKQINAFQMKKVTGITIKKNKEKKVRLTWKKQSGASGYYVLRSLKKGSGYKKIGTVKKLKFTDKKAKKRTTYYYRVQARMTMYDVEYTGKKSKAKEVYVMPKSPCTVIAGECFVDGMRQVSGLFPKNIHLVAKIGVNTYTMQHSNYFVYQGQSITGLERIAYYRPDRVYFLIGANESAWAPVSYTMKNYKQMVKLLRKINKHIEIILMKIAPFGRSSPENIPTVTQRAIFNQAYSDYAKGDKNIYYCNATDVLDDGSGHLSRKYDDGDGCHWNTSGTIAVINRIKAWSKEKFAGW